MSRSRLTAIIIFLYVTLVIVASLALRISLSVDRMVLLLLILGLSTGRARQFLKDWTIFLVVLLAWQVLSSMSRHFGHLKPHVTEMINIDRFLFFGNVPTIWLQHHFFHRGHLQWYDKTAAFLYMMHFVLPVVVAFALWYWKRPIFLEYMLSFLIVALAGFSTYVLFPAAPPWIADRWYHQLPHVARIFDLVLNAIGGQSYSTVTELIWHNGGWDLVGAVPSEHAAFPFLALLYARRAWPRAGWILLPYCLAIWVAVVYLGEHYVTDIIAGILYATAGYLLIQVLMRHRMVRAEQPAPQVSETLTA